MSPKARFNTLTSWSYSVYQQYIKCPFSVCLDKVQRVRIVETPNEAMTRGNQIHAMADLYVRVPKAPKLPKELATVKERLSRYRKLKASTELKWCFTKAYAVTSWFGGDAWLRIIVDALAEDRDSKVLEIADYKTGKVHEEHAQQRSLYGLGGLQLVQIGQLMGGDKDVRVKAEHVYLDTGQSATEEFRMKDLNPIKREWATRIKQMMSDTEFQTKTGFHCRWCRFRKSNGGPCPENM